MWTESQARSAHEHRMPHAVALSSDGRVTTVVDAQSDYYGVDFLDHIGREYLSYQFEEFEPGRLFLTVATHRDFAGSSDEVKHGTTYYFKPDGSVTVEDEDFVSSQLVTKEFKTDVAGNWEPSPSFGDYESLARVERK